MLEVQTFLRNCTEAFQTIGRKKLLRLQTQGKTVMVLGTEKEILSFIAVADEMRGIIQRGH